jgi:hypothetical protein
MKYERFDGTYWFISFFITLFMNIFLWTVDNITLGNRLSALFFFLISAFFLGLKVYKWFQEED